MRIAIANWNRRCIGGVETYLNALIPELSQAGVTIAFWSELDEPADRARIKLPEDAAVWCAADMGAKHALAALQTWQPDLIFAHKLQDPDLEQGLIDLASCVCFVHDYNGMCISGSKTFSYPVARPCDRRFGASCLLHYFPRRCGGLSPFTMLELYGVQKRRLEKLRKYDALVAQSDHMVAELSKHGLSAHRAYRSYPENQNPAVGGNGWNKPSPHQARELRLLFSGRLEKLKGAHILIEALPEVAAVLNRPLQITLAGDGRERAKLESQASALRSQRLTVDFTGWVDQEKLETLYASSDLLVVPSVWPEPFGMIGPEAGRFGLPVAAFGVGGIPDWLRDGVNGYVARESPPAAHNLAKAIVNCLSDPATHARLRRGASDVAAQFTMKHHVNELLGIFDKMIGSPEHCLAGVEN